MNSLSSASVSSASLPSKGEPFLSPLALRLVLVALGLLGLVLSAVSTWLRPEQQEMLTLWAMAGLALAALPVLYDSLTSLRADGFEATKYYMDQFVALAILACFATGKYLTGAIVASILIVGQVLEERTTLGVEEAVNALLGLSRVKARRIRTSTTGKDSSPAEEWVEAGTLQVGDVIRLLPGDVVPADGVIVLGTTTLDQASITGESLPVDAAEGCQVYAGTINLTGAIEVTVRNAGNATVIGRVTQIVDEAKSSRAPVMRLIDEYTRYYMPLVLIIAGLVLFFTREVDRAIAVIIVAMPCAFVLASPSAMVAALAVASRMGLLVKSSRFFEVAQGVNSIVFDKTGTLTRGQLQVVGVLPAGGVSAEELLEHAAWIEAQSSHPIARALLVACPTPIALPEAPTEEVHGHGVIRGAGLAGRDSWLIQRGVLLPDQRPETPGHSQLHVAFAGKYLGVIAVADQIRPEASETLHQLRSLGIEEFTMLTGDRPSVATNVAQAVGIDRVRANCLPAEKLSEVESLKAADRTVLVIGDGINDAPALAAGHLGVAMGALGSEIAIKTADVALMGHDLRHLPRFIALSEQTLRVINQNLLWGFVFIASFIALSALGLISPIFAALLHEFSAFFVLLNSARLLRFDERVSTD